MFSAHLCSDILALCCVNAHICVGVGNFLNIYEIESRELVAKHRVFEHDNIHGIVKGTDNQLFIYGGKNLSICKLQIADTIKIHSTSVHRFNDWIIAVGWTNNCTTQFLSLLFAHNNLRFYDTNDKTIQTVWCQEKCILYGGSVLTKNDGQTIVFSGTVFREILIWRAKYGDSSNDIPILHRLRRHKGVIFSVIYDPTLRLISSTSDDRTIRLWSVTNKSDHESDEIFWDDCDISLITTMYAHTARVWRSYIRDKKVFTIGEDSLMCVWSIDGNLLEKIEAHGGAEIWSIDISDDNEFIFTGGADGAVNFWHYEFEKKPQELLIYASDEGKIPKFVFYTADGDIFIFMDGGDSMTYNQCSKRITRFVNLPRYSNYCVAQISPDRKVAMGTRDGWMGIYNVIRVNEVWHLQNKVTKKVMETKIFSMHWLSNESILICGAEGHLKLFKKIMAIDGEVSSFILPASRERWTTAAILYENYLICGDRAGSVYIFDQAGCETGPVKVFSKIHGSLGVQSFTKWANQIISTGRDGTLRFYRTKCQSEEFQCLHMRKMPMDWVCRILHVNDDLYILGFKEVEFIVYSMNLRRILRRIDCGGGHRSWDCTINDEKMNFSYIRDKKVYEIKCSLGNNRLPIINGYHSKEIYSVEIIGEFSNRHNILVSAGEDCTLCVACVVETESKVQKYRLDRLAIYDGHISSIKSLAILNLHHDDKITRNLVISGGGRAQMKIWEITIKIDGKTLSSGDVTCTELLSYMLRGTDKDRKKKWQNVKPGFFVDPETRFMNINALSYPKDANLIVIFVACSDGYIRTFIYDMTQNILHLSDSVNFCNRCTLRISTIEYEKEIILMAMTTDGFLSFWRMTESIENLIVKSRMKIPNDVEMINHPFAKLKIHQSGINSFVSRKIDDSRWFIFTGGDDNLLSLVVIEISSVDNVFFVNMRSNWNSSSIHCAQITGTKFVDDNRMLSTGIDQRVVVHSYAYVDDLLSVSQIDDTMTLIPDVQGLALRHNIVNAETLACVYGNGLEVIVL